MIPLPYGMELRGNETIFTKCQTPVKSLVSSQVSLENGMMKETLRLLEHPEGCGCLFYEVEEFKT